MVDLKSVPQLGLHVFCRGLADEELEQIAGQAELIQVEAGEQLLQAGQVADAMFLILSGQLSMSFSPASGEEQTIHLLRPGEQCGLLALLSGEPMPCNVAVDQPAQLLRLSRAAALGLMERIPVFRRNVSRSLTTQLKKTVAPERSRTRAKTVAFFCFTEQSREMIQAITDRLSGMGEKIGVIGGASSDNFTSITAWESLYDESNNLRAEHRLREKIADWPTLDRILLVVDRQLPTDKLTRISEIAEAIYWISPTHGYEPAVHMLRDLSLREPALKQKTFYVWQLDRETWAAPRVPQLAEMISADFKLGTPGSTMWASSVERIVHHLRGVKIGLALSGGAAHGMAHLGVLRALDEAGIAIDMLAGTSAGVLTGVLYCAGLAPAEAIVHFAEDLQPGSLYENLPGGGNLYILAQYRSKSWDQMLRKYLNDWRLEQLAIPARTVTTDLVSGKQVVRVSGDAVDAILESINLPVLSPPICQDGMALVDGGVLNNLPADVLVREECNLVIGSNVSSKIQKSFAGNDPQTPTESMKVAGAVETLLRCMQVQAHSISAVGAGQADVVIEPDVSHFDPADFTRTPDMAEIGQRATEQQLPNIRAILRRLDPELFGD